MNKVVIYGLLALLIVWPFFGGYVLLLDWIPAPVVDSSARFYGLDESLSAQLPLTLLLDFADSSVDMKYVNFFLFFLIFFLSGISMHSLVGGNKVSGFFAGILYMVNPFVYERFLAGHIHILLAYSVLPFALMWFIRMLSEPSGKYVAVCVLFTTLVGIFNIHMLFLLSFLYLLISIYWLVKIGFSKPLMVGLVGFFCLFVFLNFYWLLPAATAHNSQLGSISEQDLRVFQTQPGKFNELMHVSMMYGFWREQAYKLPFSLLPFWLLFAVFCGLIFLVVNGFINMNNGLRWPFAICALSAQLLAVGIGHPWFRGFFYFIFDNFFLLRGFREPQKFVALVVLAYAFFAAKGIDHLWAQSRGKLKYSVWLLIILPFIYTPTIFGSFWGQVAVSQYPDEWYSVNEYMVSQDDDASVLFLPWHLYMDFSWVNNSEKRILNPAPYFFNRHVISGDNVEVGAIYSTSGNPVSVHVQSMLTNRSNFSKSLSVIGVKYILLAKEVDFNSYSFLYDEPGISVVMDNPKIALFRNDADVSLFYGSEGSDFKPANYVKKSPVLYSLNSSSEFLLFAAAYDRSWQLDDQLPARYGPVNMYSAGSGQLYYKRFNIYLIGYAVSAAAVALLVFLVMPSLSSSFRA